MQLDKTEKIIVIIVGFLVMMAFCSNAKRIFSKNSVDISSIMINDIKEYELPPDIRDWSKKFEAYEDLYGSDKPTLVYKYTSKRTGKPFDRVFHEDLKKEFNEENLDFGYIAYKDLKDESFKLILKNQNRADGESCPFESKDIDKLLDIIDVTNDCIANACIVDVKKGKYYLMTPNIDYIIEKLKAYGKSSE